MEKVAPRIDFNNTELAFQAMSDAKLRRTYWLFRMIDNPFLTRVGPKMITFGFNLRLPIKRLVRNTIFELFVGGESLDSTEERGRYLDKFAVKTILDYSVEGEKSESGFDATQKEIISAIEKGGQREEVTFCALKMTGLARFSLMEKIQRKEELTEQERKEWKRVKERLDEIAATANAYRMPIFIDAEETWIQDSIDELVEELMGRYNKENALIWHTLQFYRWDRLDYLRRLGEASEKEGYILAVKLVRGAYLEKESDRAQEMGYKDPMQPDKESTDRDFNEALKWCVDHIDRVNLCAGTHNEYSSMYLTELMAEKGIAPDDSRIWFSQLLGMSDHISFNLANAGFNVAKYLPYGPVKSVLPYLFRRAEENTAIAGQSSREVELLNRELKRRKKQAKG